MRTFPLLTFRIDRTLWVPLLLASLTFWCAPAQADTYDDVERLLGDAGIVRHRGKIESTINNARRMLELEAEHVELVKAWMAKVPQPSGDWQDDPDPPRYLD